MTAFAGEMKRKITPKKDLGDELMNRSKKFTDVTEEKNDIIKTDTFSNSFRLPSLGRFNGLSDEYLSISPMTIGQACDISRLSKIEKFSEKLKSLCTILNRSVLNVKCEDLTLEDFYALCFKLRDISSDEPLSISKDFKGITLSLKIDIKDIGIKYLDSSILLDDLDYPRVRDKIFLESTKEDGKTLTPSEEFLFGFCKGDTSEDKLDYFRTRKLEDLHIIKKYSDELKFGMNDTVEITNPEGKKEEVEVPFDFFIFFPPSLQNYF